MADTKEFTLKFQKITDGPATVNVQAVEVIEGQTLRPAQPALVTLNVTGPGSAITDSTPTLQGATLRPLPLASSVQPFWSQRVLGDINLDNLVNLSDMVLLSKALLGDATLSDEQKYAADLVDDQVVTEKDAAALAVKLGLLHYRLNVPVPSAHPKALTVNAAAPGFLLAGNAGTGVLNSEARTSAPWIQLQRRVDRGADVWEVRVTPAAIVGQTADVQITSHGLTRTVKVTAAAAPASNDPQRAAFRINPAEAQGATTVLSPFEKVSATAPGVLTLIRNDASVVFAKNAAGEVVAMDVVTAGAHELPTFNAERSAVALILTSTEMLGVDGPHRAQLAHQALTHPAFPDLVSSIRSQGRLLGTPSEMQMAADIARSLIDAAVAAGGLTSTQVHEAVEQLLTASPMQPLAISPAFTLSRGLTAQKVECNFKLTSMLSLTQNRDDIVITNRSTLGVNAYLVPDNVKIDSFDDVLDNQVGMSYLSPPDPVTGIGVADWVIGLAGSRRDSFSKDDVRAQLQAKGMNPDTQKFKVVAVATRLGGNDGNYVNTASTVNVISALNNFAQLLGIGLDGKQIAKLAQGQAATSILRAFNNAVTVGDLGNSLKDFQEANTSEERLEKVANVVTSTAAFFRDQSELFTGLMREAGSTFMTNSVFTESVDDAVKNLTKGGLQRAATWANAGYAAANLVTLMSAFGNENGGEYAQATVTDPGSDAEGTGCAAPDPEPDPTPDPTPDPGPLPPTPPVDAEDPDDGRGNGDGSSDGGNGSTLPPSHQPGRASSFGDPHLSTFDQQVFSFQAAGEFILSKSMDDTFEVQARYTPLSGTDMSANAAIAMRVMGDRVGLYASKDGPPRILVNGEALNLSATESIFRPLAFGGTVVYDGVHGEAMIVWPDGSYLTAFLRQGLLGRVTLTVPADRRGRLTGLLGNFDGNTTNDYQIRDGQTLAIPVPTPTVYSVFGESWRLQPQESLFDYEPGESTYTFTNRAFPTQYAGLHTLSAAERDRALNICRQTGIVSDILLKKCTVDVGITGNPDWAFFSAGVDPNVPALTVAPFTAQMLTKSTRDFSGIVSGPQRFTNRDVTWTATGGTLTVLDNGAVRYTAPDTAGTYELRAVSNGDPTLTRTIPITVNEPSGTIRGTARFVLTWGDTPADLDAHMWLPDSKPYHVYYGRVGADEACPSAGLDVDDTDGYGPEVLRITSLVGTPGNYHVLVNNYSREGTFAGAQAAMEVVDETGAVSRITPPEGEGYWWHVLTVDGTTGTMNVVNQVTDYYEPYADTGEGCGAPVQAMRTGALQSPTAPKPIWQPGVKRTR